MLTMTLLLLNINLILAFIINIISQLIEHLNISPTFILHTNMEMHVVLYIAIVVDTFTEIMNNYLSVVCVAQWVEYKNIAQLFLSSVSLVRIPYASFTIVTIVKTCVFIFIRFSLFCNIVSLFHLI